MRYRKNVWSSIQNFFSALIEPFTTSPMPDIPELFIPANAPGPKWSEVAHWATAIQSCAEAAQCFVERVSHCKCKGDKEHEFLSFEVSSGRHTAIVFADRSVDITNTREKATVFSPSHSPSVSEHLRASDFVRISHASGKTRDMLDDMFPNHIKLSTLVFHNTARPSVQHLATLLHTTGKHAINYELYTHSCFWFSDTVFKILRKLHPTSTVVQEPHQDQRSKYLGCSFPKANSVDEVYSEFLLEWEEFLMKKDNDERARRAEQERLLAEGVAKGREEGREEGRAEREELEAECAHYRAELEALRHQYAP